LALSQPAFQDALAWDSAAGVATPPATATTTTAKFLTASPSPLLSPSECSLRNRNVAGTRGGVATQALGPNEIALLAEVPESQVNEIFHTAGVMFAITLTGLALGFVLLRVESLVEAGNKE